MAAPKKVIPVTVLTGFLGASLLKEVQLSILELL